MSDLKDSASVRSEGKPTRETRREYSGSDVSGTQGDNSRHSSIRSVHRSSLQRRVPTKSSSTQVPRIAEMVRHPKSALRFLGQEPVPVPKSYEKSAGRRHRDWRVWPIYVREAAQHDKHLTKEWDENMDVLLIFAGLFSAVLTSFLVQSYQNLQPNYQMYAANTMYSRLNESFYLEQIVQNNSTTLNPELFQVQLMDRVVNCLWFAALTFSLSAALFAMLSKAWIREYHTELSPVAYDKARQRQFRWSGIKEWRMNEFINVLPMLLHISLFLFFAGLLVFLQPLDETVFITIAVLFISTFVVYAFLSLLPLFYADCPFKIPVIKMGRRWALWKWNKNALQLVSIRAQELDAIEKKGGVVEAQAVAWLIEASGMIEDSDAADAAVETIPTLKDTKEQRDAMFHRGVLSVLYRLLLNTDKSDEDRTVGVLTAIEILWQADSKGSTDLRRKPIPKDDLHNGFFTRLVEILETSDSERVLDVAVLLPKEFSNWPMAEWPIASRMSIPAIMRQIQMGRFAKPESLAAALDAVERVLTLMLENEEIRQVTAEDLVTCLPVVTRILKSTGSLEVQNSALGLIEKMDDMLFTAPSGWVESQITLFTNYKDGLLTALLPLLSHSAPAEASTRQRTRAVLCNLFAHPEIGDLCKTWVIQCDGIPTVVYDLDIYSTEPGAPSDDTPLRLLDSLMGGGRFRDHLQVFLNAGLLEALRKYFENNKASYDPALFAELLRRLLRLVNTPAEPRLRASGALAAMETRFPNGSVQALKPGSKELTEQMKLTRQYLSSGSVSPRPSPENEAPPPMPVKEHPSFGSTEKREEV